MATNAMRVDDFTDIEIRARINAEIRETVATAIAAGKEGLSLHFGGQPDRLSMEWPYECGRPKYPTPGVWYAGSYKGDDGYQYTMENEIISHNITRKGC